MTSNPRFEKLNHVHVTVPTNSLDKAWHFYCSIIGLTETEKPPELKVYPGFWVQLDGLQLHVGGEDTGFDRWRSGAHLSIQVDDLAERRTRLEAYGTELKPMVTYPGYDRFEFRDPWGNRLELIMPVTEE